MSHSDTDVDMIDANRPKYSLGREVSFIHEHYSGEVLVGRIASSRQIIRGGNGATYVQVTYDIHSCGMIFTNIPEENIQRHPWPTKLFNRMSVK